MPTMSESCLLCLDRGPSAGLVTCRRCADRLADRIEGIGTYLAILTPQRLHRPTERTAPGFRSSSPADDAVVAMSDPRTVVNGDGPDDTTLTLIYGVQTVLGGWAEVVADEYDEPPALKLTWAEVATWLHSLMSWLAAQSWVDVFAAEITALYRQLQVSCGDEPPAPIAACFDLTGGNTCGGSVYWQQTADAARCSRCGRVYRGAALLWLKHENVGRMT